MKSLLLALVLAGVPAAVLAQTDSRFALGAQIGTPGAGVQAQFAVNRHLVLRGSYDVLQWERDDTYSDVDYSADVDFQSPGAFIDIHPFGNAFFVSGGAYFGDRSVDLAADEGESIRIGGTEFTAEEVGRLTGRIDLESTAPFLGLGYDNTFTRANRWGVRAVAGAVFGDAPTVSLSSVGGTLSDNALFQALVDLEAEDLQEDADDYKVLPVIQLGVSYRF